MITFNLLLFVFVFDRSTGKKWERLSNIVVYYIRNVLAILIWNGPHKALCVQRWDFWKAFGFWRNCTHLYINPLISSELDVILGRRRWLGLKGGHRAWLRRVNVTLGCFLLPLLSGHHDRNSWPPLRPSSVLFLAWSPLPNTAPVNPGKHLHLQIMGSEITAQKQEKSLRHYFLALI